MLVDQEKCINKLLKWLYCYVWYNTVAEDVAERLGITTSTLYDYVNGDGSLKEAGYRIIKG